MANKKRRYSTVCALRKCGKYPNVYLQYDNWGICLDYWYASNRGIHIGSISRSTLRLLAKRINQFLEVTK